MLILAFESSAKAASVALVEDGNLVAEYTEISGLTHSKTLLPMCEDMLKNTGKTLDDVDLIAVAEGPGSFTGIRIGIATVKGIAWAKDKKCAGVSTLEAMAYNGKSSGKTICCCMDARRNQIYNAIFDKDLNRLTPDRAIALDDLDEFEDMFLIGDGAALTYDYLTKKGVKCTLAPANLLYQSACGVAMAAMGKEGVTADELLPVYLRLSQAERERQEKLKADV